MAVVEEKLQAPHGNKLVDLMLNEPQQPDAGSSYQARLELSDRNACDVELLCNGCGSVLTLLSLQCSLSPWAAPRSVCDTQAANSAFARTEASALCKGS